MIRCEYIFTYDDFLESMKVYRSASKRGAIAHWLYVWIVPAACLIGGVVAAVDFARRGAVIFSLDFWLATLGLGLAFGIPARYRSALRLAFEQRTTLAKNKPMFFEFDQSNVRFIVPQGAEIAYPWTSFTDYRETPLVSVLFIKDAAFHTIPRRAFTAESWPAFQELVQNYVRKS